MIDYKLLAHLNPYKYFYVYSKKFLIPVSVNLGHDEISIDFNYLQDFANSMSISSSKSVFERIISSIFIAK